MLNDECLMVIYKLNMTTLGNLAVVWQATVLCNNIGNISLLCENCCYGTSNTVIQHFSRHLL